METNHCPRCRSGATCTAAMIVATGSQNWGGQTVSFGVLGDGGMQYGLMAGTSQSRLASLLDPGARPSYGMALLAMFVFGFLGTIASGCLQAYLADAEIWSGAFSQWVFLITRILFVAMLVPFILLRCRYRRQRWYEAVGKLEDTWICQSCGWKF